MQLLIPDEYRDRFVHQARREGMTLSAWLRAAAHQRLAAGQRSDAFETPGDLEAFFQGCDAIEGPDTEPDWSEHLAVIDESRRRGASST
ncbi:MAG: antitoxin [Acidobacteriota bacterium]|nr:antitoxin [Acidobacteriota bacterium]